MRNLGILVLVIIIGAGAFFAGKSSSDDLTTPNQVNSDANIDALIAKWVDENPQKILDSVIKMQQEQSVEQNENAQQNVSLKQDELYNDNSDPVHNKDNFDIAVVEFFDYNCGYCKRVQKDIQKLVAGDKRVKIVFKEFPILGKSSEDLSKVAIAVNLVNPDKYLDFHLELLKSSISSKDGAIDLAGKIGVDVAELKRTLDGKDSEIQAKINANRQLAAAVGINGTPAFIIGQEIIPGAVSYEALKDKIDAARSAK